MPPMSALLLLLATAAPVAESAPFVTTCSVADHGAVPDNATANTLAFRAAARACAGRGQRGSRAVILVPRGVWWTGAFNLSSHTELRLALGATLAAVTSVSRDEYPAVAPFPSYGSCRDGGCAVPQPGNKKPPPAWCSARTQALVSAFGATDVVISGAGSMTEADAAASVIDGNGCWWWEKFMRKGGSILKVCRPQLVNFVSCTDVEVTGVTLKDPGFWNLHIWNTTGAHVHDLRIHADQHPTCGEPAGETVRAVNSDGIDVDSSQDVLVERVYIEADDDAIAIKSGKDKPGRDFGVPTRNVTVRDSRLISNDFAVGSECSGGCEDIVLRDIVMSSADSDATTGCIDVLRVKSSAGRGGFIRNILVKNVHALVVNNSLGGQKHPDVFRFDLEGSGTPVTNLTVEDLRVEFAAGIAGQFYGSSASMPIRGLVLRNVTVANSSGGWVCRHVEDSVFEEFYPVVDSKGGCGAKSADDSRPPGRGWP